MNWFHPLQSNWPVSILCAGIHDWDCKPRCTVTFAIMKSKGYQYIYDVLQHEITEDIYGILAYNPGGMK